MVRVRVLAFAVLLLGGCSRSMLPVGPGRDAGPTDGSVRSDAAACVRDSDCDDGSSCNGEEVCVSGACMPGDAPTCDDGVDCTADVCDVGLDRCVHPPDQTLCSASEVCDLDLGCTAKPCTGPADCDDGFACNGQETCGAGGLCVAGAAIVCDDATDCTVDSCSESSGSCVFAPDDGACDDGSFCNGAEVCLSGAGCTNAVRGACDDADPCTTTSCVEATETCQIVLRDQDGDGAIDALCGGTDCDDTSDAVAPGANESCANAIDDDCDGATDCGDSVCVMDVACVSCDASETSCTNGVDDDCDGSPDCADSTCSSQPICCVPTTESCTNGVDDDCDGAVDCADSACAGSAGCCVPSAEQCRNGRDDDCDGATDCADSQCVSSPLCAVGCLPFEICLPLGIDADCDGAAGCADTQCRRSPVCR